MDPQAPATVGREFHTGYRLPVVLDDGGLGSAMGLGCRFRLSFVQAGAGVMALGGRMVPFTAPCIIREDEVDRASIISGTAQGVRCLYFDPVAVNGSFTLSALKGEYDGFKGVERQDLKWLDPFLGRSERMLHMGPGTARRLSDLMDTLGEELAAQRDWNWPCRSRSYFLEILLLADRLRYEPKGQEAQECAVGLVPLEEEEAARAMEVLSYIHANYPSHMTLDELARRFHTNRTTLTKRFTRLTGSSVNVYLVNLRVQVAASMLRDTTLPVQEVMFRTGFSDASHFNRTFRRVTGCAPSEYRSLYCWMA